MEDFKWYVQDAGPFEDNGRASQILTLIRLKAEKARSKKDLRELIAKEEARVSSEAPDRESIMYRELWSKRVLPLVTKFSDLQGQFKSTLCQAKNTPRTRFLKICLTTQSVKSITLQEKKAVLNINHFYLNIKPFRNRNPHHQS